MPKAKLKSNQYVLDKGVLSEIPLPADNVVVHTTSKATGPNPKDIVGLTKASMLLFPPIAHVHAVDVMMDGAGKYDPYNWRAKDITLSGYLHAAVRHVIDYWEGEECAPDSLAKHLGHAIATLGIVLDAQAHGCLIDDRPASDGGKAMAEALAQVMKNEAHRKARRADEQERVKALIRQTGEELGILTTKTAGVKSGRQQSKKPNKSNTAKSKRSVPLPIPARGYHRRGI